MDLCEECSIEQWRVISRYFENDNAAVECLRAHGVLPLDVKCPNCGNSCNYREDQHTWRCNKSVKDPKKKKRRLCNYSVSDYKGTFLDKCHVAPWKIL